MHFSVLAAVVTVLGCLHGSLEKRLLRTERDLPDETASPQGHKHHAT
jgi:hypothetical protein